MARGDITAGEVYQDRQMLERLGYGIFDVAFTDTGVGFENVKDFSYVVAEDKDPKIYRRKVFEVLGRYYDNDLAKALWNKFIDHKWVLSEQAGHEIDLQTAAQDWFEKYGHAFLKDWTFRRQEVPERIRNYHEPQKGFVGIVTSYLMPDLRELLDAGFTVLNIATAAVKAKITPVYPRQSLRTRWRNRTLRSVPWLHSRKLAKKLEEKPTTDDHTWKDRGPYFLVKRVKNPQERQRFYIRMVAELTGHPIHTPEEAEKRWREILEHKWYMSEREGHDVGLRAAALDYYRRLNLIQEAEQGQEA